MDSHAGGPSCEWLIEHPLSPNDANRHCSREPLVWGVLNQSYGAAFIYPLYLFIHAHQVATVPKRDNIANVTPADAEALLYIAVIAGLLPVWLLLPVFIPCSSKARQFLIASCRLTPIILSPAQPLLSVLIKTFFRTSLPESSMRRQVQNFLILSGAFSVMGH